MERHSPGPRHSSSEAFPDHDREPAVSPSEKLFIAVPDTVLGGVCESRVSWGSPVFKT